MSVLPQLRILATETIVEEYFGFEGAFLRLLNVIDLGGGRAGLVLDTGHGDFSEIRLVEYTLTGDW
jgi:hypothetical protein